MEARMRRWTEMVSEYFSFSNERTTLAWMQRLKEVTVKRREQNTKIGRA
jgi:hypothetical protein